MNRESTQKLRLDRRLMGRRNWVDPATLAAELESLPDVSDKIEPKETDAKPAADAGQPPTE